MLKTDDDDGFLFMPDVDVADETPSVAGVARAAAERCNDRSCQTIRTVNLDC